MSIGIWENLNFNLNDFKCIHKGLLRVENGNFLLYRDDQGKLKLKVEGDMSQSLGFQEKSGYINKNESLIMFEHQYLNQKVIMYALPIKRSHSLVGDHPKYTDIFIVDEFFFEDSHESMGAEYLIEFVDNLKITHIFPHSMEINEVHEKKYELHGTDLKLIQKIINQDNLTRNSIRFKVEEDDVNIIKSGDRNKGLILYRNNLDPIKRDRIRKIISYILGCSLIFYGFTFVNKYMTPSCSSLMNITDNEKASVNINFQLPSPLCLNFQDSIDSNLFNVLFSDLYEKYDEFNLSNIFFTYWIAVNSNSVTAAVHYGALIEKLQANYMKIHDVSYNKILDNSIFRNIRKQFEAQLDNFELTAEQNKIFLNKISNMNTYSQKDKMSFFCKDISLSLSDIEKLAWQQRNDAAHGNNISDVDQAWKNTIILRELVNKVLLKLLTSNKYYLSYLDGKPAIKAL